MSFRNVFFSCSVVRYKSPFKLILVYNIKQAVIFFVRMPKYAVARGFNIGIYDTWNECEQQIKGYHDAKYKKFATLSEAEDFIKSNSYPSNVNIITTSNNCVKNEHQPEIFTVPRISPANLSLNTLNINLHHIEECLNNFMQDIRKSLSAIEKRLDVLECQLNVKPTQLMQTEYNFCKTESKKRPRENYNEDLGSVKALKISSEQGSFRDCSTSATNSELYGDYEYIKSEDGFVNVYTDGACSKNGKLGAKAGIGVWFNNQHPLNLSEPVRGYATNNNAEIQAATRSILQASKAGITKLNVYTDSQFMIKCITSWIHKWKRNNWKLTDGGPVKNKEELMCLDEAIQNMECVRWTYVKGHSGNVGNTEADALARKGAELYQCNVTYGSK